MADWNDIPDTAIDGDSAAIQNIFFWLRDNLIAALEGSASADRLKNAALELFQPNVYTDFGDGSDGALTVSTNSNIVPGVHQYTSFTLNSGITLTKDTAYCGPLIIKCTGTVTINGTIRAENTHTSSADTGGGGGYGTEGDGDSENGVSSAYGPGGTSGSKNGQSLLGSQMQASIMTGNLSLGGGRGGNGGNGGGAGGNGGGVVVIVAKSIVFDASGLIDAAGDGGGNGSPSDGSGGGGGGGSVVLMHEDSITGLDSDSTDISGGSGGSYAANIGGDGGDGAVLSLNIKQ